MTGISDTVAFYAGHSPPSLFWELTICQSLAEPDSLYQQALSRPRPFGRILAEYLRRELRLSPDWAVAEVGGGYGSLMRALLEVVDLGDLTMVDISPFFIERQREKLKHRRSCRFVEADALAFLSTREGLLDLVISNENLGDFPTATDIDRQDLERAVSLGIADATVLGQVAEIVRRYRLDLREAPERFHFNLGAIRYLEALAPVARRVFLSEHSSDPILPSPYAFLPLPESDGYPREIRLKGHSEYTIRFAHLEHVAAVLGYRVRRLHMAELVGLRTDPGLQAMARVGSTASETAELVHEFCAHVAEYQCLVLEKDG